MAPLFHDEYSPHEVFEGAPGQRQHVQKVVVGKLEWPEARHGPGKVFFHWLRDEGIKTWVESLVAILFGRLAPRYDKVQSQAYDNREEKEEREIECMTREFVALLKDMEAKILLFISQQSEPGFQPSWWVEPHRQFLHTIIRRLDS